MRVQKPKLIGNARRTSRAEAKRNAKHLENLRLKLIHERWLSTVILAVHLEFEAVLVELLHRSLPKPEKFIDGKHGKPTFAQKLGLCEAMDLIDDKVAQGIWAINSPRNELAHRLDDAPSLDALAKFIAAMSAIYPLQVKTSAEHFAYISLLLLRANILNLLNSATRNEDRQQEVKA